ncbi:unnamed protein product [Effrenium voratum]|nr:unnamed protein product [Effrenium voratum]
MEVGGRGSLSQFRRPLTADGNSVLDLDVEVGDRERARDGGWGPNPHSSIRASSPHGRASPGVSPKNVMMPRASSSRMPNSSRQRPPQPAGEAVVAAALSGAGRRLPGLGAPSRRAPAVKRQVEEVRRILDDNLQKDGECYAVCMAGGLDLGRLAEAALALTEVGRASAAAAVAVLERDAGTASDAVRGSQSSLWSEQPANANGLAEVANPEGALAELGGKGLVRHFGTGENIVLHLQFFGKKDVFAFGFGCIVCWTFEQAQIDEIRSKMKPFLVRPQHSGGVEEETMNFILKRKSEQDDDMDGESGEEVEDEEEEAQAKCIVQDKIILSTNSPLEKLAHSYALAQSVRLGGFELVVERSIADTRSIPETLAETGEVKLEARELSKQMGELLMLRCDVNLHTDILDTPDIFWDEERFEKIYVACRSYLDIDKRVDILNQRLVVLKDLYDLLQNSLNVKHGTKLEWIVIILILVEVVLEIIQLYFTPEG